MTDSPFAPDAPLDEASNSPPAPRSDASPAVALAVAGAVALAALAKPSTAQAQNMAEIGLLNALLAAEYVAIDAYTTGASILSSPSADDPLRTSAPTILAVAMHFQSQHRDHAQQLAAMVRALGGTPVAMPAPGSFVPPRDFTPSVLNVIKLAANAEKGAAIVYADTLKAANTQMGARLMAAIGGVEAQHFLVLSLVAQGVVSATELTLSMATDVVPRSFITEVGAGTTGLDSLAGFTFTG